MIRECLSFSLILCFTPISGGQVARPAITKTQALRETKGTLVRDWKEVISDEGRFRILFPVEPKLENEVAGVTGFKFEGSKANWSVSYSDFTCSTKDGAKLRDVYRDSANAITRDRSKVIRQNDVYVNGKLGTEFVVEERRRTIYMKALLVDCRLWTLSVDSKRITGRGSTTPKNVKQFFNSFTWWE